MGLSRVRHRLEVFRDIGFIEIRSYMGVRCRDNGKEHGNYYNIIGYIVGLYGDYM